MDELKQRIVEKILTQIDPTTFTQDVSGVELGRRQGQMALVQQLVSSFTASLEEENVQLSTSERNNLLGQVVTEVMSYRPRLEVTQALDIQPTVQRLARRGTWDTALVDYLRACIGAGRSVLVSGEAGAGKTTLLSVLATLAPDARIVSLEDVAQLRIDRRHVIRLQGQGSDLFEAALRLSPDWLVIDELTPEMAFSALQAMAAVPVMATLKGTSARSALGRLVDWVLDAAPGLSEVLAARLVADHVDVMVNVSRQFEGSHQVNEVVEVLSDPTGELGLRVVTVVTRNSAGEMAATGVESAFVKDASRVSVVQRLPHAQPPPEMPVSAPAVTAMPLSPEPVPMPGETMSMDDTLPMEAPTIPEVVAVPLPVEEAPAAPPPPAPAKKGFLAGLFGGGKKPKGPTLDTAVSAAARGAAIAATTEMTDFATAGAPPVVQKMTTYLQGDDLFDMSYAIEDGPEFLGETGIGLAETIGEGTPKRVTGFEVWMFDKETLETPSGVVLSEGAYADEALREKYAVRGSVVPARPGESVVLDTGPVRMEARVKDVAFDADGLAFDRFTVELTAWRGKGAN
jgi:energy-coupling factor transporter ATP-binding protein EcfA2